MTIADTDYLPPDPHALPASFEAMRQEAERIENPLNRGIFVFLTMARTHFFNDVNKRMGRFMMNGVLLSEGFPVINVPVKRKLEFNQLMLAFYETNEPADMNRFMRSCIDERVVKIMSETK